MELISDINAYQGKDSECALWWLGQMSFALKCGTRVLYIDLFLDNYPKRIHPPVLKSGDITNASLFLGTHDHLDHIDRKAWPALASASPQSLFIVPQLLKDNLAHDLDIQADRFIGLDDNKTVTIGDIQITGIAAAHESLDRDTETGQHPYLGYIIKYKNITIYHSGDTHIYEGMLEKLRQWQFNVMLLSINGGDNLSYKDAATIAGTLHPAYVIPGHYDMIEGYTVDPGLFMKEMRKHQKIKTQLLEYGRKFIVKA